MEIGLGICISLVFCENEGKRGKEECPAAVAASLEKIQLSLVGAFRDYRSTIAVQARRREPKRNID